MSAPTPPPYGDPSTGPQGYPTYQPPYQVPGTPPGYPPYQKPVPRRRRPSGWWFLAAALAMVVGVVVGVLLIVQTVRSFTETDGRVPADGQGHVLQVEGDEDRMVWVHPGEPASCAIVDVATGEEVELSDVSATYTKEVGSGSWQGVSRFDPGSGELEVTCEAGAGEIEIGPSPELGSFFGGLAAGILVPLVFGGGGFVMLIVLAVLFATGRPRDVPAPQ